MKDFFLLNKGVFLVKGAKRGAIYDLKSGNVYSIDECSSEIIDKCEKGYFLRDIVFKIGLSANNVMAYLKNLETLRLGRFFEIKKIIKNKIIPELKNPPLDFIWLEITENCNLKCLHCYNESCNNVIKNLALEDWIRILKEARNLGCKKCQFIGGEPFLKKNEILTLIPIARKIGYKFIEIFTNATLLNESILKRLVKLKVNLAVSLYADTANIHEKITQVKKSFERTVKAIKIAQNLDIPLRVAVIIMKQNQNYLKETLNFIKEKLHVNNVSYDIVRPSGRGCNSNIFPVGNIRKLNLRKEAKFPKFTKEDFLKRRFGHNCFADKICINANGDVIPCIMKRDAILGNSKKKGLREIVYSRERQKFKKLSKDCIMVCRDCEYRYACFDCRIKIKPSADKLYAKSSDCLYNPYTGIWEKERR